MTGILIGSYLLIGLPVGYYLTRSEIYIDLPRSYFDVRGPNEDAEKYKRSEIGTMHRIVYAILIAVYWPMALVNFWFNLLRKK